MFNHPKQNTLTPTIGLGLIMAVPLAAQTTQTFVNSWDEYTTATGNGTSGEHLVPSYPWLNSWDLYYSAGNTTGYSNGVLRFQGNHSTSVKKMAVADINGGGYDISNGETIRMGLHTGLWHNWGSTSQDSRPEWMRLSFFAPTLANADIFSAQSTVNNVSAVFGIDGLPNSGGGSQNISTPGAGSTVNLQSNGATQQSTSIAGLPWYLSGAASPSGMSERSMLSLELTYLPSTDELILSSIVERWTVADSEPSTTAKDWSTISLTESLLISSTTIANPFTASELENLVPAFGSVLDERWSGERFASSTSVYDTTITYTSAVPEPSSLLLTLSSLMLLARRRR